MKEYILNSPRIDWGTFTTFNTKNDWLNFIDEEHKRSKKVEGYAGWQNTRNTTWVGFGEQWLESFGVKVAHQMMQATGAWADEFYPQMIALPCEPGDKCTRLDIQMTIEFSEPNLFEVLRRWRDKGRKGNFLESKGGMTIYLGAWGSDRFIRIYQKSETLLRFEVSYHKAYAQPMHDRLRLEDEKHRREIMNYWMLYELMRVNDPVLSPAFALTLQGSKQKPPRLARRPTNESEKWFKRVVIPAIKKYKNSHDVNEDLLDLMVKVIHDERDYENEL